MIEEELIKWFTADGVTFPSLIELKDALNAYGVPRGFILATHSTKLVCRRGPEPSSNKSKRKKRNTDPSAERYRTSFRCGCPFEIRPSKVKSPIVPKGSIIVNVRKSIFRHHDACLLTRSGIVELQRTAGKFSRNLPIERLQHIIAVLDNNRHVDAGTSLPPKLCDEVQWRTIRAVW